MKKVFWIFTVAAALWPGVARAETVGAWLAKAPAQHDLEFTPWIGADVSIPYNHVPATAHQLFGHLTFPSVPESAYPLQISFYVLSHEIPTTDSYGIARTATSTSWGESHDVLKNSDDMGPIFYTRTETLSIADRQTPLPVWSSPVLPTLVGLHPSYLSLAVELRSAQGAILERRILIDAWTSSAIDGQVLTLSDPESDRYFQEHGQPGYSTHITFLTPDIRAYGHVGGIWIDQATLKDPAFTNGFYQQLLLSGVQLTGRDENVASLLQRLAFSTSTAVLDGALFYHESFSPTRTFYGSGYSPPMNALAQKHPHDFQPLAADAMLALRNATFIFLGAFLLFEALFMGWAFMTWGAERRVQLWWWIPVSSVAWALAGWCAAPLLLPLEAEIRVTHCTYTYGSWPQALEETSVEALGFSTHAFSWTLGGLWELEGARRGYEVDSRNLQSALLDLRADQTMLSLRGRRGGVVSAVLRRWITATPAFQWTPDHQVMILGDFDDVWFWNGRAWVDLGPAKTNAIRNPSMAPAVDKTNSVLPARLQSIMEETRSNRLMAQEGILLGWTSHATSIRELRPANARVKERSILVYALPNGKPLPPAPVPFVLPPHSYSPMKERH